jgi:hypothetical protein
MTTTFEPEDLPHDTLVPPPVRPKDQGRPTRNPGVAAQPGLRLS